MSFVERTLMIQKYIQYLRLIGLGKGRIFLHILIHVLDGVREFVVNIFAVSFYISCLQEGDGKRFFAGLLFFCGIMPTTALSTALSNACSPWTRRPD